MAKNIHKRDQIRLELRFGGGGEIVMKLEYINLSRSHC